MELYYSLNGGEWTPLIEGQNISVSAGDEIRVKNVGTQYNSNNRFQFLKSNNENGRYNVEGSITSLVGSEDEFTYIGAAFVGTGVVSAENLILPDGYYASMFRGCTGLTTAPELSTTTLADYCYSSMFRGCTSLTTAPELPATTLADSCYQQMFYDCTSLTTAPELPATTLANQCYDSMFYGCTSLTTAPALPATTLDTFCYKDMFVDCTSLTGVPIDYLPATTIDEFCYHSMFKGCTGLMTAPDLPATTLQRYCYGFMFSGCTNLNYIKCLATDISADNYSGTEGWASGVASAGTFIKAIGMNGWQIDSVNGIPVGWTAKEDYSDVPLTFVITGDGNIRWARTNSSMVSQKTIEYSKDNGQTWTSITSVSGNYPIIPVLSGETVQFRGNNAAYGDRDALYSNCFWGSTCQFKVKGNIMSLISKTNFKNLKSFSQNFALNHLFYECTGLTDASNLMLPATTLSQYCYAGMFDGCSSLTNIPDILSTTLAHGCYQSMFQNCTSLTGVSSNYLPATNLSGAGGCYHTMFRGCSSLINVPNLPATTLSAYCYTHMFESCTSLTTVPTNLLPATTLTEGCYGVMFKGCTNLVNAPELLAITFGQLSCSNMFSDCTSLINPPSSIGTSATTLSGGNQCCYDMFEGCTSLTTAPELPATTLASNCYSNMFGGCTSLTTAPELPATTLAPACYSNMFSGCTSFTTAPELPATTLADSCYASMFNGCTSLTTAPELPATTLALGCYRFMFSGCTNLNYIKCLATDISASNCTNGWVINVQTSSGRFIKDASMTGWTTGTSGIPSNWTVEDAT